MKNFFSLLLITLPFFAFAQTFEGIATYQTKTTVNMDNIGRGRMSEQMKKQIAERMKNFLEKTYTLKFTKTTSIYEEVEKLDAPGSSSGRGPRFMAGSFTQGGVYKNVSKNVYARENELMGKRFLVHDSLPALEWKIEKENKMIGQYAAFKATAVRTVSKNPWEALRPPRGNAQAQDSTANSQDAQQVITVWYTPQIPVNQGPDDYWGLPGLILEVQAGNTVIICNKVVLNPEEDLEIDEPSKGQEVTREEYEAIVLEKTKEAQERMRGRRGGPRGRNE